MSTPPNEATSAQVLVEARGLRREFERRSGRIRRRREVVVAVDGIDLTIRRGEAVGYLGPNGAGKSTTIKLLTGILVPTAGQVRVCGLDPVTQRRALARRLGVVFGQRSQLWWDLPLRESFRLLAAIHGLEDARWRARIAELDERLQLAPFLDQPVRALSLGQRMRGEVAAALLHQPPLLVLDEPTIGLDLTSKEALRALLQSERQTHGTTILLTTHDLPDIERLCDRLLVIDRGQVAFDGTPAGLGAEVGVRRVLTVELEEAVAPLVVEGAEVIAVEAGGLRQRLAFVPEQVTAAAVIAGVSAQAAVRDLALSEPAIEDVVRELYSRAAASDRD
ncbi:MAG: ABC transporter ATP-binding protein [Actinomycetales bacterium]